MIARESRYAQITTAVFEMEDGTGVLYLHRRFLPQADDLPSARDYETLDVHTRLDTVAYTTLNDPQAFWRICDANAAMNPFDLVEENSGRLRVPSGYTIR